jgi:hypothetical protein
MYVVDQTLLPACISPQLAEKALFAGKAALVLKSLGTAQTDAPTCLTPQELHTAEQELAVLTHDANAVLSVYHLGKIVEFVRSRIAGRLWQVVVDRGELVPTVTAFKEYMLAGNGLFYQELYVGDRSLCCTERLCVLGFGGCLLEDMFGSPPSLPPTPPPPRPHMRLSHIGQLTRVL